MKLVGKRIGINVLFLIPGNVGGTEIYTRQLLRAIAKVDSVNQYFVYRNRETSADIVPAAANFHDRPQAVRATSRLARLLFEQTLLVLALARERIDVLFNLGFTAPLLAWMPMVTVFYDLQYKHFGHVWRSLDLLVARVLFPACARRSAAIVAMSESVRRDLVTYYPWSRSRIVLVPHARDADFENVRQRRSASAVHTSQMYILSVSSLMPHKNFERLFKAFSVFRQTHPAYTLIVAGFRGLDAARLDRVRNDLGLEEHLTLTGWIERSELLSLFEHARAFVYASSFEGFGIPVLEALTAGLPTACSKIGPIEEIAGDAARYFDPNDVGDLSRALAEVVDDEALRARLTRDGPARATRFASEADIAALVALFTKI